MRHKDRGSERLLGSREKGWKRRTERDEKRIQSTEGRTEVKDESAAVERQIRGKRSTSPCVCGFGIAIMILVD